MGPVELTGAGVVLLVTLGVGTVAHELTHVLVLRTLGVAYDVEWRPQRQNEDVFGLDVHRALASVTPRAIPEDLPPWGLRLAAVAPFGLATPAVLILVGVLPDPIASGNAYLAAATVGWLGFALPSPQDFSLFWHAERAIEDFG